MTRYTYRDGDWRDSEGSPMPVPDRIAVPMVRSDIEPYASPVTGKMITSRNERRYDLESNGCVPYEPSKNAPKGLTNPKYAAKHGAMHLLTEEARDRHKIAKRR